MSYVTTNHSNKYMCRFAKPSNVWQDFCSSMAEGFEKLNPPNVVSLFIVCSNTLGRELLSDNSLFVD